MSLTRSISWDAKKCHSREENPSQKSSINLKVNIHCEIECFYSYDLTGHCELFGNIHGKM